MASTRHRSTLPITDDVCTQSAHALPSDVDAAASLYSTSSMLHDVGYFRHAASLDPRFDADCRATKHLTRRLEWPSLATTHHASASTASVREAWLTKHRAYRYLHHRKCVFSGRISLRRTPNGATNGPRLIACWVAVDELAHRFVNKVNRIQSTVAHC